MHNEIKFKNLKDLYDRLLPALKSKKREVHKNGLKYIHEEDIWNYLKNYKWSTSEYLDLGTMVNDIFSININELNDYVKDEIKKYHRPLNESEI